MLTNFKNPFAGYGPLPFYWWTGEKLEVERIAEQLEQMKNAGFAGVCVDYTHTVAGYQYRCNPPFFSDEWWNLWEKVVDECAKRNMTIGFDDYLITHGSPELAAIGSKIFKDEPGISGQLLRQKTEIVTGGSEYLLQKVIDKNIVDAVAYRMNGEKIDASNSVNLSSLQKNGNAVWQVPEGNWYVSILYTELQPYGAMNSLYSQKMIEYYFEKFKKHSKDQLGKAVNFFHQDELTFGGSMPYWSSDLPAQFVKSKGYDLIHELSALFTDIGERTIKVRLDYYDVATQMMEDAYFKPIFEWTQKHNLTYACDQTSRADVITGVEQYGDYFRTLRWYSAPGTDRMPELIRGKVCASLCQLYDRPRSWLEAYHSEGWGVKPSDIAKWDYQAIMFGYNLINYHSCYYTTLGGWWEWAPGDITFRQPYFPFFTDHYTQVQRLCYLLSQGKHRCDVAILFPSSVVQGDMNGTRSGKFAEESKSLLSVTEKLFKEYSIDFDFIDDESIERGELADSSLNVAGGSYKVIILPAIRYIRKDTFDKILAFYQAGGKIIALSALPEASDRVGSGDQLMNKIVKEIFGCFANDFDGVSPDSSLNKNDKGGIGYFLKNGFDEDRIAKFMTNSITRDFISDAAKIQVLHRVIDDRDVYALYNSSANSTDAKLIFNVKEKAPEEWNSKTGDVKPIPVSKILENGIKLDLTFYANELKVVVFSKGVPEIQNSAKKNSGEATTSINLDGNWNIKIEPLLDNKWGDFNSPATDELVGVETRKFRYNEERNADDVSAWSNPDFNDSDWTYAANSYGPRTWLLGPINPDTDLSAIEKKLAEIKNINPSESITCGGQTLKWFPQDYSLRWGMFNDPVLTYQTGYAIHGAIGYVPKEIVHVKTTIAGEVWYVWTSVPSLENQNSKLAVGSRASYNVWLNGVEVMSKSEVKPEIHVDPWWLSYYPYATQAAPVQLAEGSNSILLKLKTADANTYSRAFLAVDENLNSTPEPAIYEDPSGNADFVPPGFVASEFYTKDGIRNFDSYPGVAPKAMWYRFITPPGMKSMTVAAHGSIKVWIDGKEINVFENTESNFPAKQYENAVIYKITFDKPISKSSVAAIRIEPRQCFYSGAALPEPIRFTCETGSTNLCDWSAIGLDTYSGAVRYSKNIILDKSKLNERAILGLGDVNAAAKIWINKKYAGACYIQPWQIDVTDYLVAGENSIEITVANTLANHYSIGKPCGSRYVRPGQTKAGLLGPVQINFYNKN
ncbi:MAG: glycosyl hydrolase [bacterium]